jgi:hypothetical protein
MQSLADIRAQYPQYADMPDADLAKALHDKFYSDMSADEFNQKIGLTPDKYKQAAIDEQQAMQAKGIDTGAGYTRMLAHGATLGADSTLLAGLETPLEMLKRGTFNPVEGYNYAKAREDQIMNSARASTGALGTGAELLGGAVSGGGLAKAGVSAASALAPDAGLIARTLASMADASALGGFSGAMEGNSLEERLSNAGKGALMSAAVGGVTPAAMKLVSAATAPITSNFRAWMNPEGYAQSQVARAINESGQTPTQIGDAVQQAAQEGQPQFNVADAMGNAGQRLLATTARSPGTARTQVVDALDSRQATQGRRISNALTEGFGTPQTAAQTETAMTGARDTAADAAYGAVRNDAQPVNVSNAIAKIDETLSPGVNQIASPGSGIANDSVENALQGFRSRLTDGRSNLTDFSAVQRVRGDLSDAVQAAQRAGAGNRARLLGGVLRQLDASMELASPGFKQANADFAQASSDIGAVQTGRDASARGRTEDVIPASQSLSPAGQQGFRAGYVDPLIAQTQGAAFGANKARPLINDAFQQEAGAMAPGNDLMQRQIGRENTMFQTRNAATGNSKTIENANDDAAMAVDPHLIMQAATGNWHGALRTLIASGADALTGNTPAVRQHVADILLRNGTNVSGPALDSMVSDTINRIRTMQVLARNSGRAAAGSVAVGTADYNRKARR